MALMYVGPLSSDSNASKRWVASSLNSVMLVLIVSIWLLISFILSSFGLDNSNSDSLPILCGPRSGVSPNPSIIAFICSCNPFTSSCSSVRNSCNPNPSTRVVRSLRLRRNNNKSAFLSCRANSCNRWNFASAFLATSCSTKSFKHLARSSNCSFNQERWTSYRSSSKALNWSISQVVANS